MEMDRPPLPDDCGLVAAAAHKFLTEHGVKARVLDISWSNGKDVGHTVTLFQSGKSMCSYDGMGTVTISNTTWKTSATAFARKIADRLKLGESKKKRRKVIGEWL